MSSESSEYDTSSEESSEYSSTSSSGSEEDESEYTSSSSDEEDFSNNETVIELMKKLSVGEKKKPSKKAKAVHFEESISDMKTSESSFTNKVELKWKNFVKSVESGDEEKIHACIKSTSIVIFFSRVYTLVQISKKHPIIKNFVKNITDDYELIADFAESIFTSNDEEKMKELLELEKAVKVDLGKSDSKKVKKIADFFSENYILFEKVRNDNVDFVKDHVNDDTTKFIGLVAVFYGSMKCVKLLPHAQIDHDIVVTAIAGGHVKVINHIGKTTKIYKEDVLEGSKLMAPTKAVKELLISLIK
jgi:hypothetical protein